MKPRKTFLFFIICSITMGLMVGFFSIPHQESSWSELIRLSSKQREASEASIVADVYGYVHVLWTEKNTDETTLILYSRYDGETWSFPIDIYVSPANTPIDTIAPFVDTQGTLHVVWSEGILQKFLYYTYAPAWDALSISKWAKPTQTATVQAGQLDFLVDDEGVFHLVFAMNNNNGRGLFYSQSTDKARTWSTPLWFDPDIPVGVIPSKITFSFDETGGMHVVWWYKGLEFGVDGDWVRYIGSLDGGQTWSVPFTLAKNSEGDDELNNFASPVMAVSGQTIHVIWAGGDLLYRHYRYSPDAGNTWSDTIRIMSDLNGQAGDGMAVDSMGRPHYIAQIRFPMAVYHTFLSQNKWMYPQLIYFINFADTGVKSDYVEAHATYPVFRLGNQIVLTFTEPPSEINRGLFAMTTILKDAPALSPVPLPLPTFTATPEIIITADTTPTSTATSSPVNSTPQEIPPPPPLGSSNQALIWGTVVSIVVVIGVLIFRQLVKI